MKAFVVERYGDADTVRAGDVPDPFVGDDDVLVRIHAAGVNPLDIKTRDGELKAILPYRAPFVLGNDLAGEVVAMGPRVTRLTVGDEVYARPDKNRIGTFRRTHRPPPGRRGTQTGHAHHGGGRLHPPWSD